ncbi:LuxR family transcriptional regulator [Rhodococcus olei]|uniref:LuxR family transcriptional regulator n=1 Tax=Rhodococcus olei TaxID=2161675 RepID=A0ABP8NVG8_9NOCA
MAKATRDVPWRSQMRDVVQLPTATPGDWELAPPLNNLPMPLSSFVGRHADLASLQELFETYRFVTITGTGGAGKSRLALEVALARSDEFVDGCWLVELASVTDPTLVPRLIAAAVGVPEHRRSSFTNSLAVRLEASAALIVLDNCEHLVESVANVVTELLTRCGRLRILATSRELVGIPGEGVLRLAGLDLPSATADQDPADVARAESVALFFERARAVQPNLSMTSATALGAARICRHLDGLPLAIELAASRAASLGVEEIAAHMDDQFGLLTSGNRAAMRHHRTLEAAMDWSYRLLRPAEQHLFDRLAIFAGSFGIEEVDGVCGAQPDGDCAGLLGGLVAKSLVSFDPNAGPAPYSLLETVKSYGRAHLRESGDLGELQRVHASYFRALAERAGAAFRTSAEKAWANRLEALHPDLRAALSFGIESGDADTAVRLAGALPHFWQLHGHFREGLRWLSTTLAMSGEVDDRFTAWAHAGVGDLAMLHGDPAIAAAALDHSVAIFRRLGDDRGLARALQYRGVTAAFGDDLALAEKLIRESLARISVTGETGGLAHGWGLVLLAGVELGKEEYLAAGRDVAGGERVLQVIGDREALGWAALIRAVAAWRTDRVDEATTNARACLVAFLDAGGLYGASVGLLVASAIALSRSELTRMAELLGAAQALAGAMGTATIPFGTRWLAQPLGKAIVSLGPAVFEEHSRIGADRVRSDVAGFIAEVLDDLDVSSPHGAGKKQLLTRREREVAALVARGRTNRQIARALGIAEKTAEVHLHNIAGKLGASGRAEVAAWFATDKALRIREST